MAEQFPPLSATTLAAANLTGGWLAQNDLATLTAPPTVDVVVLAGNAVIPTIDAACRLAKEQEVPLLISGGIGHSTGFLYEAVREDPRYRSLAVEGRPEAHILADIAHDFWHIPRPRLAGGDDAAAVAELSRLLAGAGADRRPAGVRGRRGGAVAGDPLPRAAAGRAAAPAGFP